MERTRGVHDCPAAARRAFNRRFPDASEMARNSIRDEDWIDLMLRLQRAGITHDEEIVRLYREEVAS